MSVSLNTASHSLAVTPSRQAEPLERISSGKRINSSADDAAGLAIATRTNSRVDGFNQASRNLNDGVSLAQTANGDLDKVTDSIQRIRELSVQAANGTLNDSDRSAINAEAQQLKEEITSTVEDSNFNGRSLLNGENDFSFQAGPDSGDRIDVPSSDLTAALDELEDLDLSTQAGASEALDQLDTAQEVVNTVNAEFGATANRFESSIDNLQSSSINAQASSSRIEDADIAAEASRLVQEQVRNEAQIFAQTQGNQQSQSVLKLLS